MDALYLQSQKLVFDIHDLLPKVDRNVGQNVETIEQTVFGKLEEIARYIL